jgi:uncharacterized membrane protein YphA (DoxX/SURF4 family)
MIRTPQSVVSWRSFNCLTGFALTGAAFSVFLQKSPGGCGDYPQNFEVLFEGMGLGAGIGIVFLVLYSRIPNAFAVQSLLITIIRYYLASVILSYGFAKVFASQFPHLMANMDARFIELSPMRVAWSFFGYSRGYQIFLGWGEVIPAVLLLFRRTTLLGALIMFVVMLNVFLVNVFFDVCVKLNSGIYTVLSMYILLQEFERLWNFFIANKLTGPRPEIVVERPRWLKVSSMILNLAAVAYILWTAGQGALGTYQYANTHVANTPVQGPWRTVSIQQWQQNGWRLKPRADSLFADRIFFDGFNGVIRSDLIRDRFRFSIDSATQRLTVNFTNSRNEWNIAPATWSFERPSRDSLNLWIRWKQDSLKLKCVIRKEALTRY